MVKFCEVPKPKVYWVNRHTYQCNNCQNVFNSVFGNDYIVKFREMDGNGERWLPIYGKGGYLDLMTKLISGHSFNDSISVAKAKMFIEELNKHCEQGDSGNGFYSDHKAVYECPNCGSRDTKILREEVLTNPNLAWLKVDCILLE